MLICIDSALLFTEDDDRIVVLIVYCAFILPSFIQQVQQPI
jgi:hypothetical protein